MKAFYPNKDALYKGLAIYLAKMSGFIVDVLNQKWEDCLEKAVADTLEDPKKIEYFAGNMQEKRNSGLYSTEIEIVQNCIEIGFIPPLVSRYWKELFRPEILRQRRLGCSCTESEIPLPISIFQTKRRRFGASSMIVSVLHPCH